MIKNWGNKIASDIWEKDASSKLPRNLWIRAKALLTIMHATNTINDLAARGAPPSLRPHPLKGERAGTMAVDIDGKTCPWRITFVFSNGEFFDVAIENYH